MSHITHVGLHSFQGAARGRKRHKIIRLNKKQPVQGKTKSAKNLAAQVTKHGIAYANPLYDARQPLELDVFQVS